MKNASNLKAIQRIAGLIAIAAVIGFTFAACSGGDDGGGGRDEYEEPVVLTMRFNEHVWIDDDGNITGGWFEHDDWGKWIYEYHDENNLFDLADMYVNNRVLIFSWSFRSDIDVDYFGSQIFNLGEPDWYWKRISDYAHIKSDILKNTRYSGKVVYFPNGDAVDCLPEITSLEFDIGNRTVAAPPTLSFYQFSFEEVDKENGLNKWTVSGKDFTIDKKTFAEKVTFDGKADVLHIRPAYNISYDWEPIGYDLSAYAGKTIEIEMSMDAYLKKPAWIAWQINSSTPDAPVPAYPVICGTVRENDEDSPTSPALTPNIWHHITGKNYIRVPKTGDRGKTLYLSGWEIQDAEAYFANATMTITDRSSDKLVILKNISADGSSASKPTTQLTLTFDQAISGLSANDITISSGEKGTLSGSGPTYTLLIGVSAGGNLNVTVSKTGYAIFNSKKTVIVYSDGSNTFYNIAAFKAWLDAQPANTAATAYKVKLLLNSGSLGGGSGANGSLGAALKANSSKYVNIDLSGSPLTGIENDAFKDCTNLAEITFPPSGITNIGNNAFSGCTNLTVITIPGGVTSIGSSAFSGCTRLTAINVDASNTAFSSVNGVLYNKAKTTLIAYPAGKTGAFTIPSGVTEIGGYAFYNCTNLGGITIPSGVTSIGEYAFYSCTGLTGITIPGSITSIKGYAFYYCTNITTITFQGTIPSSGFDTNAFSGFGDLRDNYLSYGTGKYTRPNGESSTWTNAVTLNSVIANGSGTATTTQLTLTFSQAITGLSASDITLSGVSGVSKGTLSGSGPTYTLPISGFTAGGTLSVAAAKTGYTISGTPKTATIYYYSGVSAASFAGTWNASGNRSIVFSGSTFNYKVNGTTRYSGTFSASGSTITFNESSLGTASGNFTLTATTLVLSNHTWDNGVNGTYTKDSGTSGGGTVDIYVAGEDYDSSNYHPLAASWKNGVKQILNSQESSAQSVYVSGNDVYAAGVIGSSFDIARRATLWKNGVAQTLSSTTSEASSVYVSGANVYVAGNVYSSGSRATLWKNGTAQTLSTASSYAFSVYVSGSDVYVVGIVEASGGNPRATLWKNGTAQTLSTQYSHARSVYVSGSDVYVAGIEGEDTAQRATLWKNGTPQTLYNQYSIAYSVYVSGTDVYVAGGIKLSDVYDNLLKPALWKNGTTQTLNGIGSITSGVAYSVYVSGTDVYVAGQYRGAIYWKNGTDLSLTTGSNSSNSRARSIFVVPK